MITRDSLLLRRMEMFTGMPAALSLSPFGAMAAPPPDIPPTDKVNDGVKGVAAPILTLKSYCESILRQPQLDLSGLGAKDLPDVRGHQQKAKAHAQLYIDKVQPDMLKVLTNVSGYANQYIVFANSITDAIKRWEQGDLSGKQDAVAVFQALRGDISARKSQVVGVQKQLVTLRNDFNGVASLLASDKLKIESIISANQRLSKELENHIGQVESSYNTATAGVVISSIGIGAGVLGILVGVVFPPAGIVGFVLLAGGIAGVVASAQAMAALADQKKTLFAQVETAKREVAALKYVMGGLESLSKDVTEAANMTGAMANAWTFLDGHLEEVIKNLEKGQASEVAPVARVWLRSSTRNWADSLKMTKDIERMILGTKTTETQGELTGKDVYRLAA